TILPLFLPFPTHMRRTPRICVGLAVLWNVAASSTHKRGLPRLCVGLHNLGCARILLPRICLASTHVRGLENVGKNLPSTHMRAVLRICMALGRAS
ncbi:hypothetical protein PIB30_110078, partial [Stylosanthes scabra]|nr:hypothetical protein [Stylosanthes scabra]